MALSYYRLTRSAMGKSGIARASFDALHNDAYKRSVGFLVEERAETGLSQADVAERLGWNQSIVAKIETVSRRMDFVEMVLIAEAMGVDASLLIPKIRKVLTEEGYLPLMTTGQSPSE